MEIAGALDSGGGETASVDGMVDVEDVGAAARVGGVEPV
jgi:hypothetical protein